MSGGGRAQISTRGKEICAGADRLTRAPRDRVWDLALKVGVQKNGV